MTLIKSPTHFNNNATYQAKSTDMNILIIDDIAPHDIICGIQKTIVRPKNCMYSYQGFHFLYFICTDNNFGTEFRLQRKELVAGVEIITETKYDIISSDRELRRNHKHGVVFKITFKKNFDGISTLECEYATEKDDPYNIYTVCDKSNLTIIECS